MEKYHITEAPISEKKPAVEPKEIDSHEKLFNKDRSRNLSFLAKIMKKIRRPVYTEIGDYDETGPIQED